MRRLLQLINAGILKPGEVLYFTFKKHVFTGEISKRGGLIWKCTWQKPGETPQRVFQKETSIQQQPYVRTFESLTDWTETCIQECLDEYHTRYSSWKRVRHQLTDVPMEALFKHLQRRQNASNSNPNDTGRSVLVYEQLAAQDQYIETLVDTNEKWKSWFQKTFPDKPLPVEMQHNAGTRSEPDATESTPSAQPFVLTSDTGTYVVLHRLNEVAPCEVKSWLKNNGEKAFKKTLSNINQPVVFEPAKEVSNTLGTMDNDAIKQFVHSFFTSH